MLAIRSDHQGGHGVAAHEQQHEQEAAIDEADRSRHQDSDPVDDHGGAHEIDEDHPGGRGDDGAEEDSADGAEVEEPQHDMVDAQLEEADHPDHDGDARRQQDQRIDRQIRLAKACREGRDEREHHRGDVVRHQNQALLRAVRRGHSSDKLEYHGNDGP
jgi:hypothetical protein